jgi:hypothetical protein
LNSVWINGRWRNCACGRSDASVWAGQCRTTARPINARRFTTRQIWPRRSLNTRRLRAASGAVHLRYGAAGAKVGRTVRSTWSAILALTRFAASYRRFVSAVDCGCATDAGVVITPCFLAFLALLAPINVAAANAAGLATGNSRYAAGRGVGITLARRRSIGGSSGGRRFSTVGGLGCFAAFVALVAAAGAVVIAPGFSRIAGHAARSRLGRRRRWRRASLVAAVSATPARSVVIAGLLPSACHSAVTPRQVLRNRQPRRLSSGPTDGVSSTGVVIAPGPIPGAARATIGVVSARAASVSQPGTSLQLTTLLIEVAQSLGRLLLGAARLFVEASQP